VIRIQLERHLEMRQSRSRLSRMQRQCAQAVVRLRVGGIMCEDLPEKGHGFGDAAARLMRRGCAKECILAEELKRMWRGSIGHVKRIRGEPSLRFDGANPGNGSPPQPFSREKPRQYQHFVVLHMYQSRWC